MTGSGSIGIPIAPNLGTKPIYIDICMQISIKTKVNATLS